MSLLELLNVNAYLVILALFPSIFQLMTRKISIVILARQVFCRVNLAKTIQTLSLFEFEIIFVCSTVVVVITLCLKRLKVASTFTKLK
jgi:hypothetical protein